MLTVNADEHPVFRRLNKPGDEKRMVLILDRADYGLWLTGNPDEARELFKPWHGTLAAYAAPLTTRRRTKQ